MANKVKIYIHNTDGKVFELTNEKMAIHFASELHNVNWNVLFNRHVGPFDIVIADWNNNTNNYYDRGYTFVQSCFGYDEGKKIVELCRKMLKEQYDRMMMLRVAKKNNLDERLIYNLEMQYHNSKNYELYLSDILGR